MTSSTPFVTVVMPVRNEGELVRRSLESVLNQNYPSKHFEIIIAEGLSDDHTRGILQSYADKHENLSIVDNPEKIVATGLNRAMRNARGEIIVRIDGHCQITSNYIRRCVDYLQDGYDGVGGSVESTGETLRQKVIGTAMSSPFGVGNSAFRTTSNKSVLADTIPFPAYKRSLIEKSGPYDEELVRNQDDEFNFRLRKMGAKLLLAGDLRSTYYIRDSFSALWSQFFQYGFWKVRVLQKHPWQMRWRHFVPPAFVLCLILLVVLAPFFPIALLGLATLTGIYLATTLAASIVSYDGASWKRLFLLPLSFWTLHFSYGTGFLYGLFSFRKRWRG